MRRLTAILLVATLAFTALPAATSAQGYGRSGPEREYRFMFGTMTEVDLFASAGISLNRISQDVFYRGFGPRLPEKLQPFAEITWSIFWNFIFTMWPHDGGHWARANQIGGDFHIRRFGFPFPDAVMIQPPSHVVGEGTLSSIGGGVRVRGRADTRLHTGDPDPLLRLPDRPGRSHPA